MAYYQCILFDAFVVFLQVLELQLGDKVLRDTGTFCSDGFQQGAVTQHFFVKQLKETEASRHCCTAHQYNMEEQTVRLRRMLTP